MHHVINTNTVSSYHPVKITNYMCQPDSADMSQADKNAKLSYSSVHIMKCAKSWI